jgi:hypothetical protein
VLLTIRRALFAIADAVPTSWPSVTHTSADILEHEAPASTVAPNTVAPTNSHTEISIGTVALSAVAPMITHRDFHRHRGLERRGSEHRGSNEFTDNLEWPPALTYNLSDAPILSSRTHFRISPNFSPFHCPRFRISPKQSPIVFVAPYFIIPRINVDMAAP